MEDKEIKILYIDDSIDLALSSFLENYVNEAGGNISYHQIPFCPENDDYISLINNSEVQTANIVIIDSMLFENSGHNSMLTGEEFKLILRKHYPYIEVIVVTQQVIEEGYLIVPKYVRQRQKTLTAEEYYAGKLTTLLDESIKKIVDFRNIEKKLRSNTSIEKVLVEKIIYSLEGVSNYDDLTKSDIDVIVKAFQEIQEAINER